MFIISCDSFIFRDSQTVDYCNSVLVSSIYSLYASSAKAGGFIKLKKNHIHAELMTPRGVATLGSSRHVPTHNFHKILRKICIK